MKQAKTIVTACDILIKRVRFETASIRLDESAPLPHDDTAKVRAATELYTETWIVPILKLIRDGRVGELKEWVQ